MKRFLPQLILLVVVIVIAFVAVFNYQIKPKIIEQAIRGQARPPQTISAERPEILIDAPILPSVGSVEAINGVDISSEVGGIVSEIGFQSGEKVEKGDVLFRLVSDVEQADLKVAQARLANAEQQFRRISDLKRRDVSSAASLDNARADRDSARAQVVSARAQLERKTIIAPFSGVLGIRQVDLGEFVNPGQALVSLQSLDPIFVRFALPETEIADAKVGLDVNIQTDSYPGRVFPGKITSIDSRLDQSTRTIELQATVSNPEGLLQPGMFTNVEVITDNREQVVKLPETAVSFSLYGDSVWVLSAETAGETPEGRPVYQVERRDVDVLRRRKGFAYLAPGAIGDELVVTVGQLKLFPGANVTINNSVDLSPSDNPDRF